MPSFRFEEVEHTADLALKVHGHSLEEIFANAAYGMFSLIADLEGLEPTISREISLESLDYEALLVDWLNELIYWHEVEDELYTRFTIHTLSPTTLTATVEGGKAEANRAIKAATFHDLAIIQTEAGYVTTIVFDV